jgi:hypothetical protein
MLWDLEVITHLVVLVLLLKPSIHNASNGTSNALEPRSYNAFSGISDAFKI